MDEDIKLKSGFLVISTSQTRRIAKRSYFLFASSLTRFPVMLPNVIIGEMFVLRHQRDDIRVGAG